MDLLSAATTKTVLVEGGKHVSELSKAVPKRIRPSLSIKLLLKRTPATKAGYHYVSASATLKVKNKQSFALHDFQFRLLEPAAEPLKKAQSEDGIEVREERESFGGNNLMLVGGIERLSFTGLSAYRSAKKGHREALNLLTRISTNTPWLNMAEGDETQISALYEIRAEAPCLIEAVALGLVELGVLERITSWRWQKEMISQWRCSAVSVPSDCRHTENNLKGVSTFPGH
jgi:hypothetical protein